MRRSAFGKGNLGHFLSLMKHLHWNVCVLIDRPVKTVIVLLKTIIFICSVILSECWVAISAGLI